MTFHSANTTRDIDLATIQDPGVAPQEPNSTPFFDENKVPEPFQGSELDFQKASWIVITATLKDSDPERLQDIIDTYNPNSYDISTITLRETTGLLLQALDNEDLMEGNINGAVRMIDGSSSFPTSKQQYVDAVNALTPAGMYQDELRGTTELDRQGGRSSCDCDNLYSPGMSDDQILQCMNECLGYDPNSGYCMDAFASNYMGPGDCQYDTGGGGGFGDTYVGGLISDLWTATTNNLGAILNAFTGNEGDTVVINQGGGDNGSGDNEETKTQIDWGKIAIWGGVVVVVGVAAYFIFRKRK